MSRARAARAAIVAASLVVLAACTAITDEDRGPGRTASVLLATHDQSAIVLTGATPQAISVQVSAALVDSAPAVVVTDVAGAAAGAAHAKELGIPLLIEEDAAFASGAVDPDAVVPDPVADEITRLGAEHALTLGGATLPQRLPGVTAVTEAAQLPAFAKAEPVPQVAVFVDGPVGIPQEAAAADPDRAALAIAGGATGAAVGATVVTAPGGDPRADSATIETLARVQPESLIGAGATFGTPERLAQRAKHASSGHILPGGGQLIANDKLYVALYGHPGTPSLGVLGEQGVDASAQRAEEHARQYTDLTDRTVVPMFEIIATVATSDAGDGDYSNEVSPETLKPWVEKAQTAGIYVLLDLQPGTDDLVDQARQYESLLAYPHVGLAIDPEWKLKPGGRHLVEIGQVDSAEVNRVIDYLADFTATKNLPQKALVLHQFQTRMITHRDWIDTTREEIQLIIHVDGQGTTAAKLETYEQITQIPPGGESFIYWGWKNFYDEDQPMLTPKQTMELVSPEPVMISYQ